MDPLQRLIDGNRRYVDGRLQHPNQTPARREEVARGQKPFAAVVACADSRVAPEVVFDQGLGDLFVLRVAGNVANDMILGSLEYAVLHLGVGLVAVIGHKGCGAVQAAIGGGTVPGHIGSLVEAILPAVSKSSDPSPDAVAGKNAMMTADRIRTAGPVLSEASGQGKIKVVAGFYDLDTGQVGFFD